MGRRVLRDVGSIRRAFWQSVEMEEIVEMIKLTVVLVFTVALCSCFATAPKGAVTEVRVLNHSEKDISFVVVDPNGIPSRFGFLASSKSGKTIMGCTLRFSRDFSIEWEEAGATHESPVDTAAIMAQKGRVGRVTFTYRGQSKWDVEVDPSE